MISHQWRLQMQLQWRAATAPRPPRSTRARRLRRGTRCHRRIRLIPRRYHRLTEAWAVAVATVPTHCQIPPRSTMLPTAAVTTPIRTTSATKSFRSQHLPETATSRRLSGRPPPPPWPTVAASARATAVTLLMSLPQPPRLTGTSTSCSEAIKCWGRLCKNWMVFHKYCLSSIIIATQRRDISTKGKRTTD